MMIMILPCLHTFCAQCLVQAIPPQSLTLSCPVCQQQSILPEQGVSGLQPNAFVSALMELLSQACHSCGAAPCASKCPSCAVYLCESCTHPPDHGDLTELTDPLLCPKHRSQTLRFYCHECETAVCVTCTDIEHGGHATSRLKDAIQGHKATLLDLLRRAHAQAPALGEALSAVSAMATGLAHKHSLASERLEECFQQLQEVLAHRKAILSSRLDEVHEYKQDVLASQKEFLEMSLSNLRTSCELTENALNHGSDTEILLVNKEMSEKLIEIADMNVQKMPEENDFLEFYDADFVLLKKCIEQFGTVESTSAVAYETTAYGEGLRQCYVGKQTLVNITTKDRRGEIVKDGQLTFETEVYAPHLSHTFIPEVVNLNNGSYDLVYTVPKEGMYSLTVKLFGQHIKGSPFVIKAFTEEESSSSDRPTSSKIPRTTGVRQRASKRPPSYRSNGSLRKSNHIEDDLVLKVGIKGRAKGEFTNPQGVCCTPAGKIVVADSNNQCVQVFTQLGECKLKFGSRGRGAGQMQRPTGVAVMPNGNYVVADYENKWVSVFEPTGKYSHRIGMGKLLGPKGVIVDRNSHIIVVDNKSSSVLIFQENGKLLYKFGSRGNGMGKFAGPHYAAVTSKNHIVVSDFHNHCIKIFDSEGVFLTSFGSNGEGNGQFNAPTGVAVDSQDNIIVADWGNSRIQRMPGHRKRRQFKQTDASTRGMVIGLKRAGWSIRQIAADTHLGASTVHRLWRRWLEQGNVAIYRNAGATRVTSARVDRRILRQAVAAPQATCTAILQHVQDTLDHSISTRTISRRLVFDSSGSFLSFVNSHGDPLYGPQGLSLTEDGFVVVADSGNHCFKMYKYLQ
ncbi:TRIM2 [Cordylochernes scorpioides]|uniref:TRIM2 n=1 Tax=Cordylochernes scorpioides TaxID=51811 RepID=A0ABY6LRG6_9ARAC|nr:TRIM2 [Cordylochernes scorpioides]